MISVIVMLYRVLLAIMAENGEKLKAEIMVAMRSNGKFHVQLGQKIDKGLHTGSKSEFSLKVPKPVL